MEILLEKGRKTQERLESLRKAKEEEGLKECVFKPTINQRKPSKKPDSDSRTAILFADVITQADMKSRITIYEGDDVNQVTQEFADTHSLSEGKK